MVSPVSPGPSWPKSRTHSRGRSYVSSGTEPGRLSNAEDGQAVLPRVRRQAGQVLVVPDLLVPVGDHRAAAVPAAPADDVDLGGEEGVRGPDHRADVQVVLPVLDRDVERVPPSVQVRDDRVQPPVPVPVDHVAPVAVLQQLRVVARVVRPLPLPRTDPDFRHSGLGYPEPVLPLIAESIQHRRPAGPAADAGLDGRRVPTDQAG